MDYRGLYENLISTRKILNRESKNDGLLEKHHIIPKSLGGNNHNKNIVLLTPREHYLAHWLLYKIHNGQNKAKMAYAFFRMCSNNPNQKRVITARQYERARIALSQSCSGINNPNFGKSLWSDEQREEIRKRQTGPTNSMYGKTPWNKGKIVPSSLSNEQRTAISLRLVGKPRSEETKKKISKAHTGKVLSEITKQKLRDINLGKKRTKDSIEKTAAALRGRKHLLTICPYCDKEGGYAAMARWHFDNCIKKDS